MEEWKKRLVHLNHCAGVGWATIQQVLKEDMMLEGLYDHPDGYWQRLLQNVQKYQNHASSETKLATFLEDLQDEKLREITRQHSKQNIHTVTFMDAAYPKRLKEIHNPPWVLYCKGDIRLLQEFNNLAVIGAREHTEYGKSATEAIVQGFAKQEVTIVSGLARGIDSLAQSAALNVGLKVIAVIGGGVHSIYPAENRFLAERIIRNGLLLSEYPPNTKPEKWHFPMRNRIISALSRGILVIEGRERSGTAITAAQGLEQGKDIYAVPGSIFSSLSIQPNQLIRQGALSVSSAQDILADWSMI